MSCCCCCCCGDGEAGDGNRKWAALVPLIGVKGVEMASGVATATKFAGEQTDNVGIVIALLAVGDDVPASVTPPPVPLAVAPPPPWKKRAILA